MQESDMITFAAEADDVGKRIDVFAAENYEELSRSGLKKIIVYSIIGDALENLTSSYNHNYWN